MTNFRRRWISPGLAATLGLLYLPLAAGIFAALLHPQTLGRGIHLFLPFFALLTYILLALVTNHRQAKVEPTGVKIALRPFPLGNGRTVPRDSIACCYHRQIVDYAKGHAISTHYTMGIQTKDAELLDLLDHCPTEAGALEAAAETAKTLNNIEVRPPAPAKPSRPSIVAFTVWVSLLLLSIFAGAIWELTAPTL